MSVKENSKRNIKRREMLKVISAVPAAALVPLGSAEAAQQNASGSRVAKAAGYQRKTFDDHEWETVKVLCDIIIPADERSSSATQAGVPEFMDDWLDFKGGKLKTEILGGLAWLDIECNRKFSHDFIACTAAQKKRILDRIAYPNTAVSEDLNYVAFFNQLRDLVVGGFFSSKEGVKDLPYLGNKVVPVWKGCPPNVLAQIEKNLKAKHVRLSLAGDKTSA
jgi:gluconate 2-dehydrogenase gamma chain